MDGQQDVRICVWGTDLVSDGTFWSRMEYVCNYGNILYSIRSVLRVRQPNGVVRYDVWVIPQDVNRLLRKLQGRGRSIWGWTARLHQPYASRRGQRVERPVLQVRSSGGAVLVSLNVNGIQEKKPEVRRLLERSGAAVMALQETLLRPEDWVLRIPGYHCFSACGTRGPSDRGVALILKKGVSGYVVGKATPCFIAARVYGGPIVRPTIVVSLYAPSGKEGTVRIRYAKGQVQKLADQYPDDMVVLMGDWNRQRGQVNRVVHRWPTPMCLVAPRGKVRRTSRQSSRTIDHFVVRRVADTTFGPVRTMRKWDISDHYPVSLKVFYKGREEQSVGVSIPHDAESERIALGRVMCPPPSWEDTARELRAVLQTSNRWQPLADWEGAEEGHPPPVSPLTPEELNSKACDWVETLRVVCSGAGLLQKVGKKPTLALPKHIAKLIDSRCETFARLKRMPKSSPEYETLQLEHARLKSATKKAVREHNSRRWRRSLGNAAKHMSFEPRRFWKWTSSMAGWKRKDDHTGAQPVRDPLNGGRLITDAEGISAAWGQHYQGLATDVTGNSRHPPPGFWEARFASLPELPALEELDKDIGAEELMQAVRALKNNKAPGRDGVPAEALKIAFRDDSFVPTSERLAQGGEEGAGDTLVLSPMGRTIWWLVSHMWANGAVPDVWAESTVVSIPKKGDLTVMGNYRGISLMGTVLKVVMRVVSDRLDKALEEHHRFSPGQAGFRHREECPTQIACLYEACRRRMLRDEDTYLMFVDLEKAYDTVPHEGLFRKLELQGVRGRMLTFLRSVYACSRICVRSGDAPFQFSKSFPLERGLRQGCPASPILFNVFINDVLDGMPHGATVEIRDGESVCIPGLLYADDLVLLANTPEELQAMADQLTRWLSCNEMKAGIAKCAVMHVPRLSGTPGDHPRFRWTLSGQAVVEVGEYTYLGVNFRADWDIPKMVVDRCEKGRRLSHILQPYLYSRTIPVHMKMAVIRAVLVPVLLYGAEIYGMNKSITGRMQSFLTGALKAVVGVPQNGHFGLVSLWRELNVPPICALAAGRRARALVKARSLRTWVSRLAGMEFVSRRRTWMTLVRQWCRTHIPRLAAKCRDEGEDVPSYLHEKDGWLTADPKVLSRDVAYLVWRREERLRDSKNARWYLESGFHHNRIMTQRTGVIPGRIRGMNLVLKCRLGAYWTARMRARRGLADAYYLIRCPYCSVQEPETLAHVLIRCPQWETQREYWLGFWLRLTSTLVDTSDPDRDDRRVVLLLGGMAAGRQLENWGFKQPDAALEGDAGDSETSSSSGGTSGSSRTQAASDLHFRHGLLAVAGFLSSIAGERSYR